MDLFRFRTGGVLIVWACAIGLWSQAALAGGGAHNAVVIIDPDNPVSMYVGNHYVSTRQIPPQNVIYMEPRADDFEDHVSFQLDALHGMIAHRNLDGHIDYVVVAPCGHYRVPAPGLVDDPCASANYFSLSSVYTMSFIADHILEGDVPYSMGNGYYLSTGYNPIAFSSDTNWFAGNPNPGAFLSRYFIGALLGYDGERGNTADEIIAMIDRSVAADGTLPVGTIYYMETTDTLRSGPRDGGFPVATAVVNASGSQAEHLQGVLPDGMHDCLGIMTGWASPGIDAADLTILPGAFCDHLTSYAAKFDTSSQTKLSRWIAKGASGSWGAVEEPCNYAGKFPHPRVHVYYVRGASLGEAVFRSVAYVPFQMLLCGDPLTRPFSHLPEVTVSDAPSGVVSGSIVLTPEATTTHPTAGISSFELFVDGVLHSQIEPGSTFEIDTLKLPDGVHQLRVVAFDNTAVASQGVWTSPLEVDNIGRSVSLSALPESGDLSTEFVVNATAVGGEVAELRLECNGRVLASADSSPASWTVLGSDLGGSTAQLRVVAEYGDAREAFSPSVEVAVSFENAPSGDPGESAPIAYSYAVDVTLTEPLLVGLPALDLDGSILSYSLVTLPTQATIEGSGPVRLIRPAADASGSDVLEFEVSDGAADSGTARVTLRYVQFWGDWDRDGDIDLADVVEFQACFDPAVGGPSESCLSTFDKNVDGSVSQDDFVSFFDLLSGP